METRLASNSKPQTHCLCLVPSTVHHHPPSLRGKVSNILGWSQFVMQLRMTLNLWFSCLHLPNGDIWGMGHRGWFVQCGRLSHWTQYFMDARQMLYHFPGPQHDNCVSLCVWWWATLIHPTEYMYLVSLSSPLPCVWESFAHGQGRSGVQLSHSPPHSFETGSPP